MKEQCWIKEECWIQNDLQDGRLTLECLWSQLNNNIFNEANKVDIYPQIIYHHQHVFLMLYYEGIGHYYTVKSKQSRVQY